MHALHVCVLPAEDLGVLLTGCMDTETAADVGSPGNPSIAFGAFSNAVQRVVAQHFATSPRAKLSNRSLIIGVRNYLTQAGFAQVRQRSHMSTQQFNTPIWHANIQLMRLLVLEECFDQCAAIEDALLARRAAHHAGRRPSPTAPAHY